MLISESRSVPADGQLAASESTEIISRVPGDLFRAMGMIYLHIRRGSSREALARQLCAQLDAIGVRYHLRSIKRHLSGDVATIPLSVQAAMRDLLLRNNGMQTWRDIEFALWSTGQSVTQERRRPAYVATQRIIPLVELCLTLNLKRSRRSLAVDLSRRLRNHGVKINVNLLQVSLGGRQSSARREILDELLELLSKQGIGSEAEALVRWKHLAEDIAEYTQVRKLQAASQLVELALAWKIVAHEPSSRRLANMLRCRLMERGLDLGLHRIQAALDGKAKTVRVGLIAEMESLLDGLLPNGKDLKQAAAEVISHPARLVDLCWVQAPPITILAQRWLAERPEASMRQLAIRLAKTAQVMGYTTSHNTIQPILGGFKKKTRGFVYRAMLKQFPNHIEQVPAEHVLPCYWLGAVLPLVRATQSDLRSKPVAISPVGFQTATPRPLTAHSSSRISERHTDLSPRYRTPR